MFGQRAVSQLMEWPTNIDTARSATIPTHLPSESNLQSKSDIVVEYSLRDLSKPIGVSEYQFTENLPDDLRSSLPSIEQIEAELGGEIE